MPHSTLKPKIVVICGPTGVGKTSAAIESAERFGGEIISADSMQVYRQMDIGTAKATPAEQLRMPHHLIDVVDPDEPFDAAKFARLAHPLIFRLQAAGKLSLVAGGTGLYIKALVGGLFRAGGADSALRGRLKEVAAAEGIAVLYQRLENCDPDSAARINPNDAYRIIRALEVCESTGQALSAHHRAHGFNDQPFRVLKIGLNLPREVLYDRIDRRVDGMVAEGLVAEVQRLLDRGYGAELKSMQSIGYRHVAAYLSGHMSWEEALRTMKRDSRRYAKRQLTWFRADKDILWTEPDRVRSLHPEIRNFLQGD